MYINVNGHQFYDIADKEAVDAWYNTYGTAWYYGVDTSAERIFLPRDNYFYLTGKAMGNGMTLGLTNGTVDKGLGFSTSGNAHLFPSGGIGSAVGSTTGTSAGFTTEQFVGITTDPDKSGIVLEANKDKYLYICVGNTTVNEALTNVTDITSSENDTLPLGYSTYQADNLSSLAWLKSTGFFESGLTYVTFYNEYRTRIGEKFSGGYVRSVDDTYTDYDLVIDEGNQMFRLPIRNGQEGMFATPVVGNGNQIGFTDGTNIAYGKRDSKYNLLGFGTEVGLGNTSTSVDFNANEGLGITTDPTKSGIVTDPSATVVPDGWALYYKVGNAVQHLEVIDMLHEASLCNPFFYGMYQYFQTEPNNASWLASLGQWNSKGIYTDYYNWVLGNANESKEYFKLSTQEYTDYDWVVNTTDETFRLPLKTKLASGSAVAGNGMALGLTNGSTDFVMGSGAYAYGVEYGDTILSLNHGSMKPLGSGFFNSDYTSSGGAVLGINTDPTKSGVETSTDGLTLYFYVGEVLQGANLINAGRALEQIARMKVVVATYQNGTSWYRVYDDG